MESRAKRSENFGWWPLLDDYPLMGLGGGTTQFRAWCELLSCGSLGPPPGLGHKGLMFGKNDRTAVEGSAL